MAEEKEFLRLSLCHSGDGTAVWEVKDAIFLVEKGDEMNWKKWNHVEIIQFKPSVIVSSTHCIVHLNRNLSSNAITSLPAGVFSTLGELRELWVKRDI